MIAEVDSIKVNKYILRLGGISKKLNILIDECDRLEVSIGSTLTKHTIYSAKYKKDMLHYIQNKDI